jgi:hypothetical protein
MLIDSQSRQSAGRGCTSDNPRYGCDACRTHRSAPFEALARDSLSLGPMTIFMNLLRLFYQMTKKKAKLRHGQGKRLREEHEPFIGGIYFRPEVLANSPYSSEPHAQASRRTPNLHGQSSLPSGNFPARSIPCLSPPTRESSCPARGSQGSQSLRQRIRIARELRVLKPGCTNTSKASFRRD